MVVFKNRKIQTIGNQINNKMKTKALAIITTIIIVLGLTKTTFAAGADRDNFTVLNDISRINKIEVHGNVELYVSDGTADEVKVYNKYYAESALVQNVNGVLRISSYTAEKLIVWVTANDLRAISAYDNSEVKSFGDLSKIEFEVDLYNTASAKLNMAAYSANITVNDQAKADLKGHVNEFNLTHTMGATINNNNFTAVNYSEKVTGMPVTKTKELAGL
jgi:hypothetical protein